MCLSTDVVSWTNKLEIHHDYVVDMLSLPIPLHPTKPQREDSSIGQSDSATVL